MSGLPESRHRKTVPKVQSRDCSHSPNGHYGIFAQDRADQSTLMPASLITLDHFSVYAPMNVRNSAGEPVSTVPPRSAIRAFILGSVRAALISSLSLLMISTGVFMAAPPACLPLGSQPVTNSATVGMSGNTSARVAEVTASARTLPDRIYSSDEPIGSNISGTCPARRSGSGQPRYGMWSISTPAIILNSSP